MARKTLRYTVEDQGRDLGKVFLLTEMSASATRARRLGQPGLRTRHGRPARVG